MGKVGLLTAVVIDLNGIQWPYRGVLMRTVEQGTLTLVTGTQTIIWAPGFWKRAMIEKEED